MPAISIDTVSRTIPPEKQRVIFNSIFSDKNVQAAESARDASFQDWINSRKKSVESEKETSARLARVNALGNVLTTMVQPIGWAIGGGKSGVTGGVQQYDNRQYLDAFNRAMKANEDLRNIGDMEAEYQFKLADDNYRRELAIANEERKQQLELDKQRKIFDMRSKLNQEQIEGRIKVAEASARAKYNFSAGGKKVTESVRDNLLKRANTAYANILADYYKKKQVGIENLQEPPSYDEFLKQFASENGYQVADSQNAKPESQAVASGASGGRTTANLGNTSSSNKSGRSTAKL